MALLLQRRVRDARAGYMQSLEVLMAAKKCVVYTKSSLMLGLGETDEEVIDTMLDLKDAGKKPPAPCSHTLQLSQWRASLLAQLCTYVLFHEGRLCFGSDSL